MFGPLYPNYTSVPVLYVLLDYRIGISPVTLALSATLGVMILKESPAVNPRLDPG